MRILEVSPVYYPTLYPGGVPLVVRQLCERLVAKGHEVTVYATDLSNGRSRLPGGLREYSGVEVRYFRNVSNALAFRQKIFIAQGMYSVPKAEVPGFDVIHLHEYRTLANVFIHNLARKHHVPYVLQPHGSAEPVHKRELKRFFDILFGYRMLHAASKIIATAQHEAEQIIAMGVARDRVMVLPNAMDITKYAVLPARRTFRKKWGIGEKEKVILYLGRIHSGKGIDLLVKAFALLVKELPQARLVMVGSDDGFMGTVKKLAWELGVESRTLFTGYVGEEDKLAAYVDADVFFTHSSHGSMLITYLEAWACCLPVVTPDLVDIVLPKEQVEGIAGFIVPYEAGPLKNALLSILSDEALQRRLGENGRRIAEQWQDWHAWADLVEEQYYEILANKQKQSPSAD